MKIGIHQIYYDTSQLARLESLYLPYDNTANENREWAEYHIFETEFRKGTQREFDYTGFFSWKYLQKSRIPGERFIRFVRENPGADVCFINPFPMEELLFRNVWLQGEFYHPGITAFSQKILGYAGYEIDLADWKQSPSTFAFCNYWVGSAGFWQEYMAFTGKIAGVLRNQLNAEEKEFIHSIASRGNNFSYIAFIMERLFSTYLHLNSGNVRACRYEYSTEELKERFPGGKFRVYKILSDTNPLTGFMRYLVRKAALLFRAKTEP